MLKKSVFLETALHKCGKPGIVTQRIEQDHQARVKAHEAEVRAYIETEIAWLEGRGGTGGEVGRSFRAILLLPSPISFSHLREPSRYSWLAEERITLGGLIVVPPSLINTTGLPAVVTALVASGKEVHFLSRSCCLIAEASCSKSSPSEPRPFLESFLVFPIDQDRYRHLKLAFKEIA